MAGWFDIMKNVPGIGTKEKIVVFSVDDYGNVRLDSKKARDSLIDHGCNPVTRFDEFDCLETTEDLEILFQTLTKFKGSDGNPVVFTSYALPCNIDFDSMIQNQFMEYKFEILPITFEKQESIYPSKYGGVWELWKEGMGSGIFLPQFHGREHFNLKWFTNALVEKNEQLITSLNHRSLACIRGSGFKNIRYTMSFAIESTSEIDNLRYVLKDGLEKFTQVFGKSAIAFTPSGQQFPKTLEKELIDLGIKVLDRPFYQKSHVGNNKFSNEIRFNKRNKNGLSYMVRNVVFEPCHNRGVDWVSYSLKQIEKAFILNKPAIISSHRVNYCGGIDSNYRKKGIESLDLLLRKIIKKWPDVRFMSVDGLYEHLY